MNPERGDTAAALVDAVLAVDGVVAIVDDPGGTDDRDAGAPGRVTADRGFPGATHVHVTVTDAHDPTTTAQNVQDAAHRVTGGRVDVTIEEILEH
ncbi:hypothetical protein ACQ7HM_11510 [Williamsia sp. MIQD14]|uniref:hypothetical protein n=1 Tax=Williamsia sp. MIQD14 TaxID=3425703 RepID=UPI003DA18F79